MFKIFGKAIIRRFFEIECVYSENDDDETENQSCEMERGWWDHDDSIIDGKAIIESEIPSTVENPRNPNDFDELF